MKTIFKLLGIAAFSAITSCKEEPVKSEAPCPSNIICTEVHTSLLLYVKDPQGRPVALDKILSIRRNGQTFEFRREYVAPGDTSSAYPFWSDSERSHTQATGETLTVKGIKNSQEVFRTQVKVGHDCCHVQQLDEKTQVIVSLPD